MNRSLLPQIAAALLVSLASSSCEKTPNDRVQGYAEGEFVYVSSPLPGTLQQLFVRRGDQVRSGQPLFTLDETMEQAAHDQARAALVLSEADFKRQEQLFRSGPAA
ncbi:MAG: biotin/lipoyl-binding protein, partial [Bryobacteraceae bacterium]